jgi:hypothetical protein
MAWEAPGPQHVRSEAHGPLVPDMSTLRPAVAWQPPRQESTRTHMNSLIHISHTGKGKGPRGIREKGKRDGRHLRCISTEHSSPRARTHNTKVFPVKGACLKANLPPPTPAKAGEEDWGEGLRKGESHKKPLELT